ncbi:hypothetical protein DB30_02584 [Enhygromyxa salina]|uniref:Uncharacterized protein n=1 Tax=Enhygromyxa salina TaxID=215803 RepID=A0A0C2CKK1_9BACT|nr:hypothetical protein [Enhygromyxa salina]KIG11726.1 hypothetical protein DB30_02584 [Enhygromyxa salina]
MTAALAALGLGCLPPANIKGPIEPALTPAPTTKIDPGQCRALVTERGARGPLTHELRWDGARLISSATHRGLMVGSADQLFALRVERVSFDPVGLYGEAGAALTCEQDVISTRRFPDGVDRPLIEATPACTGEFEGQKVALESTLSLQTAIGPLLSWRARTEGYDPARIGVLTYRTLDLRSSEPARPEQWLLAPSQSMTRDEPEHGACTRRDAPRTLADTRGFAIAWHPDDGTRLRIGYRCCTWERNHGMCEFEDPLPQPDPELAAMLPDADLLLHSPFGCGSIGLDGGIRTREGVAIGEHEVAPADLLGVVFLPSDHPFELAWLDD